MRAPLPGDPLPGDPVPEPVPEAQGPRRASRYTAVAVGVVLALFLVLLATREPLGARFGQSPLVGAPAPALAGATLDGTPFDLVEAEGRWVVVNFFATWCVPCRVEHPELVTFSELAADNAVVVSVVFDDEPTDVARYFAERGGDWPVLDDPEGRIALDYGVTGIPESYLIDPTGVVVDKLIGGVTVARIGAAIERAQARDQQAVRR